MTRVVKLRYDVVCVEGDDEPAPEPLLELVRAHVTWRRVTREQEPGAFVLPKYLAPTEATKLRFPTSEGDAEVRSLVSGLLDRSTMAYVITAEGTSDDLTPLQAAMGLAGAASAAFGGVVVDRIANLGYAPDDFQEMADALNDSGDHLVRDAVVIEVESHGPTSSLQSSGMSKYGQRDFAIEDFPTEHVELARRVLYDSLCQYSAMRAEITPGQVVQYKAADPSAVWFFGERADGRLRVTDCDAKEKQPVPGLARFLAVSLPAYLEQLATERASAEADANRGSAGLQTLDDYVAFTKMIQSGKVQEALARFGLTFETLGPVTDAWSKKLEDPELAIEFTQKLGS